MVVVDAIVCGTTVPSMLDALRSEGVLAGPMSTTTVRFVTHKDVDAADMDTAIAAFSRVVGR
jgi:threonine aldolase